MTTAHQITWRERLEAYYYLCRFDKPVGTELVFWPTMWALWIAAEGIPRNLERTRSDALLASDAALLDDSHGPQVAVVQGAARADLHAGGVGAVHAAVLPEEPFHVVFYGNLLETDQGPGIGLQIGRILVGAGGHGLLRGKAVPLLAGQLAAAAAGTFRNVDEFGFLGHVISPPS